MPIRAGAGLGLSQAVLLALVYLYRVSLGLVMGGQCRFSPSCSTYALGAIAEHGAWGGAVMVCRRLLRCHPWDPGGFDPVPPRRGPAEENA